MQIGIDDFGEFVRPDTSQSHDFFYDIIFNTEYVIMLWDNPARWYHFCSLCSGISNHVVKHTWPHLHPQEGVTGGQFGFAQSASGSLAALEGYSLPS